MDRPSLVEPGTKYFFNETLKKVKLKNSKYNNNLVNLFLFLFFIFVVLVFLYYKKQMKITKNKIKLTNLEKQQYILNQVRKANEKKLQNDPNMITNLPKYESEFENFNTFG